MSSERRTCCYKGVNYVFKNGSWCTLDGTNVDSALNILLYEKYLDSFRDIIASEAKDLDFDELELNIQATMDTIHSHNRKRGGPGFAGIDEYWLRLQGIRGAVLCEEIIDRLSKDGSAPSLFALQEYFPKLLSCYRNSHEHKKNIEFCQQLIDSHPSLVDSKVLTSLSAAYCDLGDYKNAFYYFTCAANLETYYHSPSIVNLGRRLGRIADSISKDDIFAPENREYGAQFLMYLDNLIDKGWPTTLRKDFEFQ